MFEDTATSAAVTSSHDACSDVNDDVVEAGEEKAGGAEPAVTATENVDISSTSLVRCGVDDESRSVRKSECRVCGDDAAGMYFGALVCVPCKVRRRLALYTTTQFSLPQSMHRFTY